MTPEEFTAFLDRGGGECIFDNHRIIEIKPDDQGSWWPRGWPHEGIYPHIFRHQYIRALQVYNGTNTTLGAAPAKTGTDNREAA